MKNKKFVSIIWGYSTHMYGFAPEENYHLHALAVAKQLGFVPYAIVRAGKKHMEADPHFDPAINVIDYKNAFQFFFLVLKLSFQGSLFYVNSYEWQSFLIPFISRKTIFMAHTQPKRQSALRQHVQNFVYRFFTKIRLNNEEEKAFLIAQHIPAKKLAVVPLVVSSDIFKMGSGTERKDLVYFGNVTAKKNVITILKAFERVKTSYPDIKMHIIGNIWDKNVEDFIARSSYKADVILHGFMPNELLVPELNSKYIYLNASTDEGQCVAVYDAALCGCVLCLPNIMSFEGVFKDKALFHDVFDDQKLTENIVHYLKHPETASEHSKKLIEMIQNGYSKEMVEKKLKALIMSI